MRRLHALVEPALATVNRRVLAPVGLELGRGGLRRPRRWAISIERVDHPLALDAPASAPTLTAADVDDVPAAFVADPFLAHDGQTWHVLFEILNRRRGKGEIGLATRAPDGHWAYRGVVLRRPAHLSYPFVFHAEGEWWLCPESGEAGGIDLYVAEEFPTTWRWHTRLVEGPDLADPTLFFREGWWWLYAESGRRPPWGHLRLFGAPALDGPWTEHPCSPLTHGDPTHARPAGRPLEIDGRLIRLAQDCSRGATRTRVRGVEVTELDRDRYAEQLLAAPVLAPDPASRWCAAGTHHLDARRDLEGGWLVAYDGCGGKGSTR